MKEDRIQRFTLTEVLLHWLNAVLYLVLAVTGATMVLGRLLDAETTGGSAVSAIHRLAGKILIFTLGQAFLLSLLTAKFRRFWLTLRQCLSWERTDLSWLLKVPLNMFSGRVSLPPVGRFNPGQKLHILVVFVLLIGFSLSGLAMMLVPGALAPWIVHLFCFVLAALFLLLHLFLAFVNPQTRKALPGIITGSISEEYAREHHALLLGRAGHVTQEPYVSWRAATVFLLAIVAICGAKLWRHGLAGFGGNISSTLAQRGANLIMPGRLCASHAANPRTQRCLTCHSPYGVIASEACLQCHENIGAITAAEVGYHGMLDGPCRDCHKEHLGTDGDIRSLDAVTFNHDLARFALDGKHRKLSCTHCHLEKGADDTPSRTRYIGLKFGACSDCHDNPHKDERAAECTKCHTPEGWKQANLIFAHDRDSRFALEGGHSDTPCDRCHVIEPDAGADRRFVLYDIGASCSQCHPDPHNSQFAQGCDCCHSEQGWTGRWLVDAHSGDTVFPLMGKHSSVACIECHPLPEKGAKLAEAPFVGLSQDCVSCHEDQHKGQMRSTCDTCHAEQGWTGRFLLFDHELHSEFKIDAIHANLSCDSCHNEADTPVYRPLPKTCELCHADIVMLQKAEGVPAREQPDPHANRVSCVECHSPLREYQRPGDYAAACRACHNRHYEGLFYNWMKSLNSRQSRAEILLEHLQRQNSSDTEIFRRKINEARRVGFHNTALAVSLWGEILAE